MPAGRPKARPDARSKPDAKPAKEDNSPYVVDTIPVPFDNPYKSWMRTGGFDFFKEYEIVFRMGEIGVQRLRPQRGIHVLAGTLRAYDAFLIRHAVSMR